MSPFTAANLLAWAIQVGIIVLLAAPLPRLLGLWEPRARVVFYRLVLLACLLLPLLQPRVTLSILPAPSPQTNQSVAVVPGDATAPAAPLATTPSRPSDVWTRWPLPVRLEAILLGGIALRLTWLGLGLLTVRRLRRSASRLWPRPGAVDRAVDLTGVDAEFLVSPVTSRPVTCGVVWPVVLVPLGFDRFPELQQTAIACHELLHVGRFDWVRNVFDEFVRTAAWFHPAIWWLTNQIQLAREQVVDREAVRLLGARQPYLEALLRLATPSVRLLLVPAAPFLRRAHLRQRVTMLVKEVPMSKVRLAVSFAIMAMVLCLGGRIATSTFPLVATAVAPAADQGVRSATGSGVGGGVGSGVARGLATGSGVGSGVGSGLLAGVGGGVASAVDAAAAPGARPSQAPGTQTTSAAATARLFPTRTDDVRPVFPPLGREAGAADMVILRLTLDEAGGVAGLQASGGSAETQTAAADAARQWRFTPPPNAPFQMTYGLNPGASPIFGSPQRVGGNIKPPQKTRDVKALYPTVAQAARVQGIVIVETLIDPDGLVAEATVLRSIPLLDEEAIKAVLQWRFATDGTPLIMTVTVNFVLADGVPGGGASGSPNAAEFSERLAAAAAAAAEAAASRPAPPPPPADAVRVGGGSAPPTKVRDVKPAYPEVAQAARIQGVVICEATIGTDGKVQHARVLRSIPLLDQAAVEAVMQWEFTRTLLNNVPVPVIMTVTVKFELDKRP